MASLHIRSGGTFYIAFRFQGTPYLRSLGTSDETQASRKKAIVEQTLQFLADGVYTLDEHVTSDQLWRFLRSGGKLKKEIHVARRAPLKQVCKQYLDSFSGDAKESSTLTTETIHTHHFLRIFGKKAGIDEIGSKQVRDYVAKREKEPGNHGRTIQPVTIKKELQTLSQIWEFATSESIVTGQNPVSLINKPRGSQKIPFMTWEEIEKRIDRGGLTQGEIAELWEALFLREAEIGEVLDHVNRAAQSLRRFPYIYPALAFCAYTGARRSEMFRCRVDDVNGQVLIREKKRVQDRSITFREVPLHDELKLILQAWLRIHPGGQFLFCKNNQNPLEDKTAREAFRAAIKASKWKVLRGYPWLARRLLVAGRRQ